MLLSSEPNSPRRLSMCITICATSRRTAPEAGIYQLVERGRSVGNTKIWGSRSFLVQLFLRIAGVSYGPVHGMRCKLICQRIFRTVGDR